MLRPARIIWRRLFASSIAWRSTINPPLNNIEIKPVKSETKEDLPKERKPIPIVLLDKDLEESFVKGSGPGGQKINKNKSCVQLKHIPTGIAVETQRFRELVNNRKEARKLLALKLDKHFNGKNSKLEIKYEKIKKQLAKKKQRAKAKYAKEPVAGDDAAS
ncbi:hypothetical protein HDV01_000540 [Terramyces sp. JEL0728]|nr:hypothetical protein HDV01_000540 [Terramyces sp. JEL0728]